MELYIQLKNGQPFEHPIFADNFRQAFPDVDTDNLPPAFARFIRIPTPEIGVYEVYNGVNYELSNGVVSDVHVIRPMTNEEKIAKQNEIKAIWANGLNYASWAFNEATCQFDPPAPYPNDEKIYQWDEASTSWVEVVA